jgi:hypothetical protein
VKAHVAEGGRPGREVVRVEPERDARERLGARVADAEAGATEDARARLERDVEVQRGLAGARDARSARGAEADDERERGAEREGARRRRSPARA